MRTNSMRVWAGAAVAAAAAAACSVMLTFASTRSAVGGVHLAERSAADSPAVSPTDRREIEIAFYADRAARDTLGAADRSRLAALYLDRARETGSFTDLERAERVARESLKLRTAHNAATYALLASILMGQHRFPEALQAAERADAIE